MKTVIVNLYAGPGAGKTTCAWEIASRLKKENVSTEYVSEYAKELVWEGNLELLSGSVESHRKALRF
jgi:tRNA uridine 5-carbamoylmethylation protein Kti12